MALREQRSIPPELAGLLERPVAVHPVYCRIGGSVDGGVLLSQLVYWSTGPDARARGGWVSHEADCIEATTGVRPDAQVSVRRRLVGAGVLVERRTVGGRVAYKVDLERLAALVRVDAAERAEAGGCSRAAPCGCADPGLAVRAAEVAARKSETGVPVSGNGTAGVQKHLKTDSHTKDSKTTSEITSSPSDGDDELLRGLIESLAAELAAGRGPGRGKEPQYIGRILRRHITREEAASMMVAARSLVERRSHELARRRKAEAEAANLRVAEAETRSRAEGDRVLGLAPSVRNKH